MYEILAKSNAAVQALIIYRSTSAEPINASCIYGSINSMLFVYSPYCMMSLVIWYKPCNMTPICSLTIKQYIICYILICKQINQYFTISALVRETNWKDILLLNEMQKVIITGLIYIYIYSGFNYAFHVHYKFASPEENITY